MGYSKSLQNSAEKTHVSIDKVRRKRKRKFLAKILSTNHTKTKSHNASKIRLQSSYGADSKANAITKCNIFGEYAV